MVSQTSEDGRQTVYLDELDADVQELIKNDERSFQEILSAALLNFLGLSDVTPENIYEVRDRHLELEQEAEETLEDVREKVELLNGTIKTWEEEGLLPAE